MTTKTVGGKITGLIGLTLEANYAAAVGDIVMGGPGDFQVVKCDGTKPPLGWVSVKNVTRGTFAGGNPGAYPVAQVPGDVTVEARGYAVRDFTVAAGGFAVGVDVGCGALGTLAPTGAGVLHIGIALMAGVAGQLATVLMN